MGDGSKFAPINQSVQHCFLVSAFRENPELVKAVEAEIALGRFGEPSEIAAVVAFLASDEGHWVTGQTIEASGGYKL